MGSKAKTFVEFTEHLARTANSVVHIPVANISGVCVWDLPTGGTLIECRGDYTVHVCEDRETVWAKLAEVGIVSAVTKPGEAGKE